MIAFNRTASIAPGKTAALDAVNSKILADKQYMVLASQGSENFLPGSLRDSIWRTV